MALVRDIVTRFRAETNDYLAKIDAAKAKNREIAKSLLETAGSADRAIASLNQAKNKNALGDFGLDKRQVGGIITQIRQLDKELKATAGSAEELAAKMQAAGQRANAIGDVQESFGSFFRGDFLKGYEKLQKGLADLQGDQGLGGVGIKAALAGTAIHMIGAATASATRNAVELRKQYQEGAISAGQMFEKIMAGLPLIGGLWETGRNLRVLLGLENDLLQQQIDMQQGMNDKRQELIDISRKMTDETKRWGDETARINAEIKATIMEMGGGLKQAQEMRLQIKLESNIESARKEILDGVKELNKPIELQLNGDGKENKGDREKLRAAEERLRAAEEEWQARKDYTGSKRTIAAEEELKAAQSEVDSLNASIREKQETINKNTAQGNALLKERTEALQKQAGLEKEQITNSHLLTTAQKAMYAAAMAVSPAMAQALLNSFDNAETAAQQDAKDLGKTIGQSIFSGASEWLKPFGKQIKDAIKDAKRQAEKAQEEMKRGAERFKESSMSDAEKMSKQIKDAVAMREAGLLTTKDIDKSLTKEVKALQMEMKGIETERKVYSVDVKELRGGQTLYAPPSKTDEKALARLEEIKEILRTIRDEGGAAGVTIEELNV